jgi:hypothetical protein
MLTITLTDEERDLLQSLVEDRYGVTMTDPDSDGDDESRVHAELLRDIMDKLA